jgi:outer membrane lipase/esterase
MKLRRVLASAAVVLTAVFVSTSAMAQASNYDRIISFGDSLSDNGNLPAGVAPPPPYDSGRFSNGPTWAEILAGTPAATGASSTMTQFWQSLAPDLSGHVNMALGGARADGTVAFPPGVPTQIGAYGLAGGTFGANDLVTLWAGANDIFQSGTPVEAAQAQNGNVQSLIFAQNARTILIANLPDLGATPFGTPSGTLATKAYNAVLDAGLKSIAASAPAGVNIIEMDAYSAFNVIRKDPGAFGLTNVTAACIFDPNCTNPDKYLFWDAVHPTLAGHILLAQYANLLLSTGQIAPVVAPLAEVGLNSRMDASDASFNRALDLQDGYERSGMYAQIIGNRFSTDANGSTPAFDYDLFGVRGGLDMRSGGFSYGLAFGYQSGKLKEAALTSDVSTMQADIHATAHLGAWFLTAQGGYSHTELDDISRATGFGPVKASANAAGDQLSAALGAGRTFRFGSFALTPGARVGYVTSNVGAFAETADVLALQYDSRDVASGFWDARLRASTNLGQNGDKFKAFVEAGYQDFFATETDAITAKLVNNTALPVTVAANDPGARGAFVKLGVDAELASGMTISAEYALSLHDEGGENHSGMVQLKIPLSGEAQR